MKKEKQQAPKLANQLVIGGELQAPLKIQQSPTGFKHAYFTLCHQSTQLVGSLEQSVYCKLKVVALGSKQALSELSVGQHLIIKGFILRRKTRLGDAEIWLQATKWQILSPTQETEHGKHSAKT